MIIMGGKMKATFSRYFMEDVALYSCILGRAALPKSDCVVIVSLMLDYPVFAAKTSSCFRHVSSQWPQIEKLQIK